MAARRREDRRLAHLAADLHPDAGGGGARRHRGGPVEAAALGDADVEVVDGARGDQRLGVGRRQERLVGHDRHADRLLEPAELGDGAARQGLLDGGDPERGDGVEDLRGALDGPRAIGVEPQRDVGAEDLAQGRDPGHVVREPDLQLHVLEADRAHLPRVLDRALHRPRRDDAAIRDRPATGWEQRRQRPARTAQRAVDDRQLEGGAARVGGDDAGDRRGGDESVEGREVRRVGERGQLTLDQRRPEIPREVLEHHVDRFPGHVRAGHAFAEALRPRLVTHPHHHRVRPAALRDAVAEGLHEGDAERVEGGGDEPHRAPIPIDVGTTSRKYRRANTLSRSVSSMIVSAASSASS